MNDTSNLIDTCNIEIDGHSLRGVHSIDSQFDKIEFKSKNGQLMNYVDDLRISVTDTHGVSIKHKKGIIPPIGRIVYDYMIIVDEFSKNKNNKVKV